MNVKRRYGFSSNRTVTFIGDEGAHALSEALKVNTTLTSLYLKCAVTTKVKSRHNYNCKTKITGNRIGVEGVCTLSEALKVNTTLTILNLSGMKKQGNTLEESVMVP